MQDPKTTRRSPRQPPDEGIVAAAPNPADAELIVYGTTWCGDCHRSRRFLDQNRVPYHWIDVDEHPEAAALIRWLNGGRRKVPTIVFPDGSVLIEPSNAELGRKLAQQQERGS